MFDLPSFCTEWKLGGFENATPSSLMNSLPIKILPSFEKYDPPEKVDSSKLKSATKWYKIFVLDISTFIIPSQTCNLYAHEGQLICGVWDALYGKFSMVH